MKRSEAINHIVNVLQLTGNHYCDDDRDKQDAEKILKRLEDIGMQPPNVTLEELFKDGLHVIGDTNYYAVWEDEDEQ